METTIKAPKVHVEVDKTCIEESVKAVSSHCMVAEALKKARPKATNIHVDIQTIRMTDPKKGKRYIWLTPKKVAEAIYSFDLGVKPQPFSFNLGNRVQVIDSKVGESKKTGTDRKKRIVASQGRGRSSVIVSILGGKEPKKTAGNRRHFGLRGFAEYATRLNA